MSNKHKTSKNKKNDRPRTHRRKRKLNRSPYFKSFTFPRKVRIPTPSKIPYDMKIVGKGLRLLDYQLNGLKNLINEYKRGHPGNPNTNYEKLPSQIDELAEVIETNINKSKATSRELAPFQIRYRELTDYVGEITI